MTTKRSNAGVAVSQIEQLPLSAIRPCDRNSKLHPPEQIKQIIKSISEVGFLDPIAVDETGEILAGHGRYIAAQKMNLQKVPVIKVEGLTDAQKAVYRIAHNKIALNSDFDPDALKVELEWLNSIEYDLSLTGFEEEELEDYLDVDLDEGDDAEETGVIKVRPQVFGGPRPSSEVYEEVVEEGEEAYESEYNGDSEPSDEVAAAPKPESKYPLAIVLTWEQWKQWKGLKESLKIKNDTNLVLALIERFSSNDDSDAPTE